ncbi:MAG: deaminase [Nanoarchaeota archaeon]|nr:deaminase [Nanoarchaeota archaeon]
MEEAASHQRPTWDEYFLALTKTIGLRGTCNRGRAGCIIVKKKRILTTGYVGSPPEMAHCDEVGHWFKQTIHEDGSVTKHCIRTIHAEANAIAQAANSGVNVHAGTLYCKMEPCLDCTKLLISAGIKRVVCEMKYHAAKESREMLEEAGILLEVMQNSIEEYAGQKKLD